MKSYYWNREATPEHLHALLEELEHFYPLSQNQRTNLEFIHSPDCNIIHVETSDSITRITYSDVNHATRGLGAALAGLQLQEYCSFNNIGVMLDCSRNAVFKVDYLKTWIRRLALLGYNRLMLYLEDIYELPDEDYFGYLRGRYTASELQEIDDYADMFGISVIACIQTCGHMSQILRWSAYTPVADTPDVLLADNEETYLLIEKMITFFKENLRSNIIHIGMDEAHDMGRGKFQDHFGSVDRFNIFENHLKRVSAICDKHALTPLIWSDMYFRMGSNTDDYYDLESILPDNIATQIPENVDLVYWDYYHDNEPFYDTMIKRHQQLNGRLPIMCSAIWSWACPWYNREFTEKNAPPAIDACKNLGINDIYFALWNDNGAAVDFESTLAGVTFCSEYIYSNGSTSRTNLEKRFHSLCDTSYRTVVKASDINSEFSALGLLWDDPLLGIFRHNEELKNPAFWDCRLQVYQELSKELEQYAQHSSSNFFNHIINLTRFLALKLKFMQLLEPQEMKPLNVMVLKEKLPEVQRSLSLLKESFRKMWLERYKPFGLEVLQIRLAGQEERWHEIERLLGEYENGNHNVFSDFHKHTKAPLKSLSYRFSKVATASAIL